MSCQAPSRCNFLPAFLHTRVYGPARSVGNPFAILDAMSVYWHCVQAVHLIHACCNTHARSRIDQLCADTPHRHQSQGRTRVTQLRLSERTCAPGVQPGRSCCSAAGLHAVCAWCIRTGKPARRSFAPVSARALRTAALSLLCAPNHCHVGHTLRSSPGSCARARAGAPRSGGCALV